MILLRESRGEEELGEGPAWWRSPAAAVAAAACRAHTDRLQFHRSKVKAEVAGYRGSKCGSI